MNTNESYASDIISRYVYAVTKRLPLDQRGDIEKELRGLIDDMLLERCGENAPTPKEVDAVLIELGAPEKLAQRYNEHPSYLIGPEYYDTYLLIVKIVMACVAFGLFIANVVLAVISSGQHVLYAVGNYLATTFMALIQAFAFITLGFAFAEYFKGKNQAKKSEENWYPNTLPPLQPVHTEIKKGEAITGIVFSCLIIILFNFAPQLIGIYSFTSELTIIPIFNMDYFSSVLPLFNLCFTLGLAREILMLTIGRYTIGLCAAMIIRNIISIITVCFIFGSEELFNQNMWGELYKTGLPSNSLDLTLLWSNSARIFLAILVFAFLLDTGVVLVRTIKSKVNQ